MKLLNKIHPIIVDNQKPTEELGKNIISLRYDLILPIIDGMLSEAERQKISDAKRGRNKLSNELGNLHQDLLKLKETINKIVSICKPYIEREKKL